MYLISLICKGRWKVLLLAVNFFSGSIVAQNLIKNEDELSLPISGRKLVIAHCMTNIIRYKGHKFEDSCDPAYYSSSGNITASIGGLTQVLPMEDSYLKNASLDSAVAFEMRAALASGIDGFQFYYPLGTESWDNIIKAYFRVAEKQHIPFYFTFCISHPSGGNQESRIASYAQRINDIFSEVGRNNTHWLRTPDGRLIVYLWNGDGLADIPANLNGFSESYYIALAYKILADAVQEKFASIFLINEQISSTRLNEYLDYFPACWIWTLPYTKNYIGKMIAATCKIRNRTFTGSTFCDFYTSKLLERGTWNIYSAEGAAAAGIEKSERKYIVTGLSYNFRKLMEFGIHEDVPIINIITWNDYPEGHHLAPEINHNEGFSILLNYYKTVWKKEPSPYNSKDVAVVFFKKYKHNTVPQPYHFKLVDIEKGIEAGMEDSIEVITLLKQPSLLEVNGHSRQVGAGFRDTKFSQEAGSVKVNVYRGGSTILQFITPQKITLHPYRTDRLTYSYSSEFAQFYEPLLGKDLMQAQQPQSASGLNQ
ncbi:MAG TPA: endo-1,3-alpha-glucanase family glycosylhydrolase [Puia sp.]